MHADVCTGTKYATKLDAPRHRGKHGALSTGLSTGEDQEPERVRTVQPGSQLPSESRWQGDGDARRC